MKNSTLCIAGLSCAQLLDISEPNHEWILKSRTLPIKASKNLPWHRTANYRAQTLSTVPKEYSIATLSQGACANLCPDDTIVEETRGTHAEADAGTLDVSILLYVTFEGLVAMAGSPAAVPHELAKLCVRLATLLEDLFEG